jgi:hypothetical protein
MPMIFFLPKHFAEVNFNPITFPESEDDMTTGTAIERERKIRHVDVTPLEVQPGETLVFQNHSKKYRCFTIEFNDPKFATPGDELVGNENITIIVAKDGEFTYKVRHYKDKSKKEHPVEAGPFGVRSCPGGCNQ